MESLKNSAEATKKVMGGMAEHFAGPPSMSMGTVDWHFKGRRARRHPGVARDDRADQAGVAGCDHEEGVDGGDRGGAEAPGHGGDDRGVRHLQRRHDARARSSPRWPRSRSVETQTRDGHEGAHRRAADAAERRARVAPHARPAARPVSERGAVSVALVPDDSYPAGFAVRIRPLVGLAAGSSAEARCRVSYDVKTGTKVDVVALGHGETELVKRLAGSFERAVLSFALASGAAATSGSDDDLWRKFVFWASKRDGGAGWYDELGRLGKPTTPERLVGVTSGARI